MSLSWLVGNGAHVLDEFVPKFKDCCLVLGITRRDHQSSSRPKATRTTANIDPLCDTIAPAGTSAALAYFAYDLIPNAEQYNLLDRSVQTMGRFDSPHHELATAQPR